MFLHIYIITRLVHFYTLAKIINDFVVIVVVNNGIFCCVCVASAPILCGRTSAQRPPSCILSSGKMTNLEIIFYIYISN